jgi:hypothetical protein
MFSFLETDKRTGLICPGACGTNERKSASEKGRACPIENLFITLTVDFEVGTPEVSKLEPLML